MSRKFKSYIFLISLLIFVFLIKPAYALNDKQFTIDYDISYKIEENGEVLVEQKATLTNQKNDVVPTNYTFSIREIKIYDILAETNGKKVNVQTLENENENESGFSIPIENQSIGKDKKNEISVKYKTKDIAIKGGSIWNVFIPKIETPNSTEIYNVKVYIPKSFGPKMYFSPTPVSEKEEEGSIIYYLTKETFRGSGISAAFGPSQVFNFKIKYQLQNKNLLPSNYEITLPPDVENYQQVVYTNINPKPLRIKVDKEGNSIAVFNIKGKKSLEVELIGSAKTISPQINLEYGKLFEELPKDIISKYTKQQKYWDTKSDKIIQTANKLKNENLNVVKNASLAYDFVVDNLSYDFDAIKKNFVERQGSEIALTQKGSWTCMEFTDLFIALARTMGIPAREVNGYAFSSNENSKSISLDLKNGDSLHSWAEFYDENYGWIQVDPTWGYTSGIDYFSKMDTNRIVLIRRGLSSEYPRPAGSFRYEEGKKLIEVDYSQNTDSEMFKPKFSIKKVFNFNLIQIIKGNRRYEIKNESNVFLYTFDNKVIVPGGNIYVYLDKNTSEFSVKTSLGEEFKQAL